MYITLNRYNEIYGQIDENVFNRICYDACKLIDRYTTGVDGVNKLRVYFPVAVASVEAVERCTAEIVNILHQIEEAEKSASLSRGYMETEDGLRGKIISSATAGNVSVSYATGSAKTAADIAVTDRKERKKMIDETIRDYLSGVADANGVNLLYMGVYPNV